MAQQPKDEAMILIQVSYPGHLAIPASLANQVLPKLEMWSRQYTNGKVVTEPMLDKTMDMFLISERDVIAARMVAAMIPKEEN
jgi:hypothetical protein